MQFSSGPFAIEHYANDSLVGCSNVVLNSLTDMFPSYASAFQTVTFEYKSFESYIKLDLQFKNDERTIPYTINVSIIRLPAIQENEVTKTKTKLHFTTIGKTTFTFDNKLNAFEDQPTSRRQVHSLRKQIQFDNDVKLQKGDQLALLLQYKDVRIHWVCVSGFLAKTKKEPKVN